jgi:hypothetical protein
MPPQATHTVFPFVGAGVGFDFTGVGKQLIGAHGGVQLFEQRRRGFFGGFLTCVLSQVLPWKK